VSARSADMLRGGVEGGESSCKHGMSVSRVDVGKEV
jgi:hypothetical protein